MVVLTFGIILGLPQESPTQAHIQYVLYSIIQCTHTCSSKHLPPQLPNEITLTALSAEQKRRHPTEQRSAVCEVIPCNIWTTHTVEQHLSTSSSNSLATSHIPLLSLDYQCNILFIKAWTVYLVCSFKECEVSVKSPRLEVERSERIQETSKSAGHTSISSKERWKKNLPRPPSLKRVSHKLFLCSIFSFEIYTTGNNLAIWFHLTWIWLQSFLVLC